MATPLRNVRVEDELWERARVAAEARETDVSTVIRRALETYAARYERQREESE